MPIKTYLSEIEKTFKTGIAREHAYRGFLQNFLHQILPKEILVTNEPARILCGSPDYVLTKKNIPIGYIEAKDLDANLSDKKHQEQLDRYRFSLPNFIFTNYIDFHFYHDGELTCAISIAKILEENLVTISENFEQLEALLKSFSLQISQSIKSPKTLAQMMAKKAKLLAIIIENALNSDEENQQNSSLKEQMSAFKEILIHNIKPKEFADIYAQTIAYGMFAARLHDQSLNTFSRQEAADLIPKTNPFLRKLFQYVAGYDLDQRLVWIIDDLAEIFRSTDIAALLENFGKTTKRHDPIIHFYETFLSQYDPLLRKNRGVWYTPESVVSFIVRGVDEILKTEFNLKNGIADTSKIKKKISSGLVDRRTTSGYSYDEKEFHKVQILDPATGTGTFLCEVIKQIHEKFIGQKGIWQQYVDEHLTPRLNGFELLMASYAMAHLKLDLLLRETGYKSEKNQDLSEARFKIFLTNSLEEADPNKEVPLLAFMRELTLEGLEASRIKNDTPVMVILGNPPYLGESQNKSEWIMKLMEDYKKEPVSGAKLKEKNPKWINDDYVKFLRFGQYFIEKNGEGILAFINPHGFLDNPTFRGMRYSMLKAFDKIYTIDLHGNSKKKETALDGSKDENVFDIQQGVSINFFVKRGGNIPLTEALSRKGRGSCNELGLTPSPLAGEGFREGSLNLAEVFHFDCFGKREQKNNFLWENSLSSIPFKKLENAHPNYFFVPKDFGLQGEYRKGFAVNEVFPVNSVGVVTAKDTILINESEDELVKNVENFYQIKADRNLIQKISYRPFDDKFIYYDLKLVERAREKVMQHFLAGESLGLVFKRQCKQDFSYVFLTKNIAEGCLFESAYANNSISPLYLYSKQQTQNSDDFFESNKITKTPNLNPEIVAKIAAKIGLEFAWQEGPLTPALSLKGRGSKTELGDTPSPLEGEGFREGSLITNNTNFSPLDIFDYIYAVLHSPNYRKKYQEFLKIDFPRIPYPESAKTFFKFANLGKTLRKIHLLEEDLKTTTSYPIAGSNKVENVRFVDEKIYINNQQFFENISLEAYEFFIGGYQVLQKYLKDRKNKILTFEEILHYQKIIAALKQTIILSGEIDKILEF